MTTDPIIIYLRDGKVRLTEEWDLERTCEVLREVGHTIQRIQKGDEDIPLTKVCPEEAA